MFEVHIEFRDRSKSVYKDVERFPVIEEIWIILHGKGQNYHAYPVEVIKCLSVTETK